MLETLENEGCQKEAYLKDCDSLFEVCWLEYRTAQDIFILKLKASSDKNTVIDIYLDDDHFDIRRKDTIRQKYRLPQQRSDIPKLVQLGNRDSVDVKLNLTISGFWHYEFFKPYTETSLVETFEYQLRSTTEGIFLLGCGAGLVIFNGAMIVVHYLRKKSE